MRRAAVLIALAVAGCGGGGERTATRQAMQPPKPKPKPTPSPHAPKRAKVPPPAPPGDVIHPGDLFSFETPSKKIGCAYTRDPATLRCDTAFPTRFSRGRHRCREGDYGQAFRMDGAGGRSRAICASDTVLSASGARTIPYGHAWNIGPFACTSMTSSLTCTNQQGHGWRLSREQQLLF